MARVHNSKVSKLIRGLEKVIDRQNSKPKTAYTKRDDGKVISDLKIYNNKSTYDLNKMADFYYPLKWQPLKYIIKSIPHTTYTYKLGESPQAKYAIRSLRRKKQNSLPNKL